MDESDTAVIRTRDVTKAFNGVVVLDGINVDIEPGTVTALLGENGAGKSTLLKIMAGVYAMDSGQMWVKGMPAELSNTNAARELGIAFVHQELHLAANRTVMENIMLGWEAERIRGLGVIDQKECRLISKRALELVGASGIDVDALVRDLSPAQQQLVEIAKALAWPNIDVVLMDEPTSSLPEEQTQDVLQLITSLKEKGISVVLTTHKLNEAFEIADSIVVMRDGMLMDAVDPRDENVSRAQIVEWMVGRPMNALFPAHRTEFGDVVLDVDSVSGGIVQDVSFQVREGEVLGIGGLVGAGRTELSRLLFQADRIEAGTVEVRGKPLVGHHPTNAVAAGVALVPEDRKNLGLVQMQTTLFNLALASLDLRSRFAVVNQKQVRKAAQQMIDMLRVKTRGFDQPVSNLSGGNQQKVVLGKWLTRTPSVLLLDEPTRGVDVGARAEIYEQIDRIARSGVAVVLISSDMEELIGMGDRVLVMANGRVSGELNGDSITPHQVLALASEGIEV